MSNGVAGSYSTWRNTSKTGSSFPSQITDWYCVHLMESMVTYGQLKSFGLVLEDFVWLKMTFNNQSFGCNRRSSRSSDVWITLLSGQRRPGTICAHLPQVEYPHAQPQTNKKIHSDKFPIKSKWWRLESLLEYEKFVTFLEMSLVYLIKLNWTPWLHRPPRSIHSSAPMSTEYALCQLQRFRLAGESRKLSNQNVKYFFLKLFL